MTGFISQLQVQLFAKTSASVLSTITDIPELHVLHAPLLCFPFLAMYPDAIRDTEFRGSC